MCQTKDKIQENGTDTTKKNCSGKCLGKCKFAEKMSLMQESIPGAVTIASAQPIQQQNAQAFTS